MKIVITSIFLFINSILLLDTGYSQNYYKISCNITIKEKIDSMTFSLYKGNVVYDKYKKRSVWDFYFPRHEKWIISSDSLIKYENNKITLAEPTRLIHDYSIFSLFFDGTLKNYGLKKSTFEIKNVETKKNGQTISTWIPPATLKNEFGKIVIAQKDNLLVGVAFYSPKDSLIAKQVYQTYETVKGLKFPSKIYYIYYNKGKERYKITTFKSIKIE